MIPWPEIDRSSFSPSRRGPSINPSVPRSSSAPSVPRRGYPPDVNEGQSSTDPCRDARSFDAKSTSSVHRGCSLLRTTFATSVDPYARSMIEHIPRRLAHRSTFVTLEILPLPPFLSSCLSTPRPHSFFRAQYLSNKERPRAVREPSAR